MKKSIITIIIFCSFLTSGCFLKEKDLGQMFFPISLGIEYEENKYKIYLQVLDTSSLSIVETESGQRQTSYILIHTENESISEAFTELGLKTKTYISAIKLKSIILHNSVLQDGPLNYEELCKYFINSPLFRTKIQMFVTNTNLKEFYSVRYMLVGSSVYSHTNENNAQIIRGYAKQTYLIDNLKSHTENNRMYYFPIMDVKEENIDEGDSEGKLKPIKTYFYNGICYSTYSKENISCLSKEEAIGTRWHEEVNFINVELGTNKNPTNIIINKNSWSTNITKDNTFEITLKTKGYISLNVSNLTIDEITKKLNETIKKDILNTLKISYQNNIDVYHLNDYAFRKNKDIKYNLNNVIINIDSTIENTTYYKY